MVTGSPVPGRRTRPSTGTAGPRRPVQRDAGWLPLVIATGALLLAAYLLVALGTPPPTPSVGDSCYDRVVYHAARLTDC